MSLRRRTARVARRPSEADAVALRRFWQTARGFWHGPLAWALIAALVIGTVLQVVVQYRLNFWNRLVDNFPRLAEWLSSANRVGMLLSAFDRLDRSETGVTT